MYSAEPLHLVAWRDRRMVGNWIAVAFAGLRDRLRAYLPFARARDYRNPPGGLAGLVFGYFAIADFLQSDLPAI
jgi:hypothetical protein